MVISPRNGIQACKHSSNLPQSKRALALFALCLLCIHSHLPLLAEPVISSGDILLAVNGNSVLGLPLSRVKQAICGAPGTRVHLSLQRCDQGGGIGAGGQQYDVELQRSTVRGGGLAGVLGSAGGIGGGGDGVRRAFEVEKRVVSCLETQCAALEVCIHPGDGTIAFVA